VRLVVDAPLLAYFLDVDWRDFPERGGGEIGERVWLVTASASSLKRLLLTVPTSASHFVASVIRVP
jgi:hypothetical protein